MAVHFKQTQEKTVRMKSNRASLIGQSQGKKEWTAIPK